MCMMGMGAIGGIASAGMNIMGAIAQNQAEQDKTNQYNQEAAENARNAGIAASNKYTDLQTKYIYDARQNQQEGQLAATKGLAAKGTSLASAGSSGFSPGSATVSAILADEDNKTAAALDNNKTKLADLGDSLRANLDSTRAEAQQRISSMPFKAGPDQTALGINIASAALGGVKGMMG